MTKKLTADEEAARFAKALVHTCDAYHGGFMTHATWTKHMRSLWGQIERDPLVRRKVTELITPAMGKNIWRGAAR